MGVVTEQLRIETGPAVASLRDVETGLQRASLSADEAREGFGRVGESGAKLAGAASLLSPELGSVALGLADLADVGEVAATAAKSLGISLGAAGVAVGALLAVLGTAAYAWSEYTDRQEAAAEATADYLTALSDMRAGLADLTAAFDELELREGVLSKVLTLPEAELARAQRQAGQVFAGQRDTISSQLQEEADRLAALRVGQQDRGVLDTLFGAGSAETATEISTVQDRIDELQTSLASLDQQEAEYGERLGAVITGEREATEALRDRNKAQQEARKEQSELIKELDAASKYWFGELQNIRLAEEAWKEIQQLQIQGELAAGMTDIRTRSPLLAQLDAMAPAAEVAMSSLDDLMLMQADLNIAFDRGQITLDQYTDALARLNAAMMAAGRTGNPLAMQLLSGASSSMGVLGGDLLGGLSMLGPQGAAIGAVLGGLQGIGAKGAAGVADEVNGLFTDLVAGVEALPQILGEILPDAIAQGVPALVEALIIAAPDIAIASVKAQAQLLETLILDLPVMMGEALGQALRDWWNDIKDAFSNPFDFGGGGGNTFAQKLQNTAVDALRVVAGVATFGGSEVLLGAANGATDGAAQRALYAGSREDRRSRQARSAGAWMSRPGRDLEDQRLGMQLGRVLNEQDRRNNLDSSTGVAYRPAGPTRM